MSDVEISANDVDVTETTTSTTGAEYIEYGELPADGVILEVETEFTVQYTQTFEERECVAYATPTPTPEPTDTPTPEPSTPEPGGPTPVPVQDRDPSVQGESTAGPSNIHYAPERDDGGDGGGGGGGRECIEYDWFVDSTETTTDTITVSDSIGFNVPNTNVTITTRYYGEDRTDVQISGADYWTGATIEGRGFIDGPYDTYTKRVEKYDTLVAEGESGKSDEYYSVFTPVQTHAYPGSGRPQYYPEKTNYGDGIKELVSIGEETKEAPELPEGVNVETAEEPGEEYVLRNRTAFRVYGASPEDIEPGETIHVNSILAGEDTQMGLKNKEGVIRVNMTVSAEPIYETEAEEEVDSLAVTVNLMEEDSGRSIFTEAYGGAVYIKGEQYETNLDGSLTTVVEVNNSFESVPVRFKPDVSFAYPIVFEAQETTVDGMTGNAGIFSYFTRVYQGFLLPVILSALAIAFTLLLIRAPFTGSIDWNLILFWR